MDNFIEKYCEKYGRSRLFIISFCVLSFLLIAEAVLIHNLYNTTNYKGHRLKLREIGPDAIVMVDRDNNELRMSNELDYDSVSAFTEMDATITFLNDTIQYSFRYMDDSGSIYTFSDGSTFAEPFIQVVYNYSYPDDGLSSLQKAEKKLVDKLLDYYHDHIGIGVFVGYVLFAMLFLLLSNGSFFYPESFWRFNTFLTVQGGEPTDLYLFMNKLSSIFITAFIYIGLPIIIFAVR